MNIDECLTLIKQYNYNYIGNCNQLNSSRYGIGDLLLFKVASNNNLVDGSTIYFNLFFVTSNPFFIRNIKNYFMFRLELLSKLYKPEQIFFFYHDKLNMFHTHYNANLTTFNSLQCLFPLNPSPKLEKPYIVFHTKCRFSNTFDYNSLKSVLNQIFKMLRCKYTVVLLGERNMYPNYEVLECKITTIYNELLQLKQNNNVIDLTVDNIFDNLDYNNWEKDLGIIHNAEYNIGVGESGQFVNCICFSKQSVYFIGDLALEYLNTDNLKNNQTFVYRDINQFFKHLILLNN